MSQSTGLPDLPELEALVRRLVREELASLLRAPASSILEDWRQEGPDSPAEDALLLQDALAILAKHRERPDAWVKLEDLEAELELTAGNRAVSG